MSYIQIYKVPYADEVEVFIGGAEEWDDANRIARETWDNLPGTEKENCFIQVRYGYRWAGVAREKMVPGCFYPGVWEFDVSDEWAKYYKVCRDDENDDCELGSFDFWEAMKMALDIPDGYLVEMDYTNGYYIVDISRDELIAWDKGE